MKTGCLAVFTVLALLASPLTAGLIVFEEFDSAPPSPPWTSATSAGYSIIYGGEAVFAGSGNGSARLTYSVPVAGDFLAGAVVIPGWNLAHGGALGLAAFWEDSNFFDIYLRNIQGNNELAAYNSRTGQNPWQPWSGEATLLLVRSGNSIYAGAMSDVPSINGTPDLSGFLPLASDLWFGYTQVSFWQFYNFDDSSPFRETNYEPELLLNFRTDFTLGGWRGRFLNLGFNHQSNGQSEPLSRSWNRLIASAGFERGNLSLLLKGWYRIPESAEEDDNPRMERYLGYGEVWGYYFWKGHRFGLMLRNNLDFHTNRGAVQAEWSFPILERVSGYVQYYNGFGESLLDYNYRVNRIGVGFMLRDWN